MTNSTNFAQILKADKFDMASEILLASGQEFATELAEMLREEGERVRKSNARSKGKKTVSKALVASQERAQAVIESGVMEEGKYYDFRLVSLVDADVETEPKARQTLQLLVEEGYIVALEKRQKFADAKAGRKAFVLANQDLEGEFEAFDLVEEVAEEVVQED